MDDIQTYIYSCFNQFQNHNVLDIQIRPFLHEIFVTVHVNQKTEQFLDIAKSIEKEFEELGRVIHVTVK